MSRAFLQFPRTVTAKFGRARRASDPLLRLFVFLLVAALAGCPKDEPGSNDAALVVEGGPDAEPVETGVPDGGMNERDFGIRDAAYDGGAPDTGPEDVGPCECTFGFHHRCPEGQACVSGNSSAPMCSRTVPWSGSLEPCTTPTARGESSAMVCNAQCRPVQQGSVCGQESRPQLLDSADNWTSAMAEAADPDRNRMPKGKMSPGSVARARGLVSAECSELVGWSVLANYALCHGTGSITLPTMSNRIEDVVFRPRDDDPCQTAAGACAVALSWWLAHENVAAAFWDIPSACPNGLPFAAPCDGADGMSCVHARILEMGALLLTAQ